MVAPKDESSDLVMQWIAAEGLGSHATISPRLDSVIVEASISQIENLLNTEYTPFGETPNLIYIVSVTF
jgi:tripeptidyl-peptidase I